MKTSTWSKDSAESFFKQGWFLRLGNGDWLIGWGDFEVGPQALESRPTGFYIPDFFLKNENPWHFPEASLRLSQKEFLQAWADDESGGQQDWQWQEPSFKAFEQQFQKIQQGLSRGELEKAVPVVFARSSQTPTLTSKKTFLNRLAKRSFGLMVYGYWLESGEGMLGLTPEVLFCRQTGSHRLTSMALAGTSDPAYDLIADQKERHEHQLVIDDIKERLGIWGEVEIGPTQEWDLGPIKHLKTSISAQLAQELSFDEICRHLHPTPALGAAPRARAWEWLRSQPEATQRKHFGAPFGVRVSGEVEICVVAIRNLQWEQNQCWLGSGCGIVGQSQVKKEWKELQMKRDSLRKALGL